MAEVESDWTLIDAELLAGRIVHGIAAYREMTALSLQAAIEHVSHRVDSLRTTRGEEFSWAPGDIEFYS